MNELTVVGKGGVKHPDILTEDEAQNLLDRYGTGGTAITIPGGINLQKYLGRVVGGFYYDDASTSGTTGGPIADKVHYTVLSAAIPGNRMVIATSHGNRLWTAEIYGDVFQGWSEYGNVTQIGQWISEAIAAHALTRDHPYARENAPGFIEIADSTEAPTGTENTRAMTSLRVQNLLDTYGVGTRSIYIPKNANLATYFNTVRPGFYHLDSSTSNGYTNIPTDAVFGWAEIISTNHEATNYRALTMLTAEGRLYTATVTAGSFSGWKRKIELADIPYASSTVAGLIRIQNSVTNTSTTDAASANAVKVANDNANTRVPQTRRVNGLALTNDINITPGLIGTYTKAEIDAKLAGLGSVQDIRWSGATWNSAGSFRVVWTNGKAASYTTVPNGAMICQIADYRLNEANGRDEKWLDTVDGVQYRYLQKLINGTWLTVGAL